MFWLVALGVTLVMSLVSFVMYGWDKRAAAKGSWRTSEKTLLLIDLAFGWPGGLAGQRVFKHKRRKTSYMLRFWGIVVLHVIFWGIVLWWRFIR